MCRGIGESGIAAASGSGRCGGAADHVFEFLCCESRVRRRIEVTQPSVDLVETRTKTSRAAQVAYHVKCTGTLSDFVG